MNKTYIGIDIGKLGGIVAITPDSIITQAMPLIGDEINQQVLADILFELKRKGNEIVLGIENVHSLFQAAAGANFQFGRALGIVEGMVVAFALPFYKVSAKAWQKVCFEGIPVMNKPGLPQPGRGTTDTKAMASLAAQRLYPSLDLRGTARSKTPHKGIVDALLIAHYCKLKY